MLFIKSIEIFIYNPINKHEAKKAKTKEGNKAHVNCQVLPYSRHPQKVHEESRRKQHERLPVDTTPDHEVGQIETFR